MPYVVYTLDDNLNPSGELANVRSVSVEYDATDDTSLVASASLSLDTDTLGWSGGWCRVDYIDDARYKLGVFRFTLTKQTYNHDVFTVEADGYSVLKPAQEQTLLTGSYAYAGVNVGEYVAGLLNVCPTPVTYTDMQVLTETVVFDSGISRLEAAWKVLDKAKWCIQLDGDGTIELKPIPSTVSFTIDANSLGNIEPSIDIDDDDISYSRRFISDVRPFDLVEINIPRRGISGTYNIKSQSIDCDIAPKVSETIGTLKRGDDDDANK